MFLRRVQSGKSSKPSKTHPASGLDFDIFFEGENENVDTEEDMMMRASPMDVDAFFSSMSKICVPMVGQPQPPPPPRTAKLSIVAEEEEGDKPDFPMAIRMLNPDAKR